MSSKIFGGEKRAVGLSGVRKRDLEFLSSGGTSTEADVAGCVYFR
jgi:hypothetical protein